MSETNPSVTNLSVNGDRLWQSLMEIGEIGATPKGGVCRLALSDEDRQGRDLFIRWCEEVGCTIRIDRMGNIFARRAGLDNSLPPIMNGSHLDTVPTGGKFDGILGVMAGLEVLRTLHDLDYVTPGRGGRVDQRGGLAFLACHGFIRRLRGRDPDGDGQGADRQGWKDAGRGAEAHRLRRRG